MHWKYFNKPEPRVRTVCMCSKWGDGVQMYETWIVQEWSQHEWVSPWQATYTECTTLAVLLLMIWKRQIRDRCDFKEDRKVALMWGASIGKGTQWHPQMSTRAGRSFGNGIGGGCRARGCCRLCHCQQQSSSSGLLVQGKWGQQHVCSFRLCRLDKRFAIIQTWYSKLQEVKFDFFFIPSINSVQRRYFVNVFFSILSHRHFFQRSAEGTLAKRMPYGLLRDVIHLQHALSLLSKCAVCAVGVQIVFYTRGGVVGPSWFLLARCSRNWWDCRRPRRELWAWMPLLQAVLEALACSFAPVPAGIKCFPLYLWCHKSSVWAVLWSVSASSELCSSWLTSYSISFIMGNMVGKYLGFGGLVSDKYTIIAYSYYLCRKLFWLCFSGK